MIFEALPKGSATWQLHVSAASLQVLVLRPDVPCRPVVCCAVLCPAALSAAEFLHKHDAAALSPQQHLALLTQLLDDVMDTSTIRDLLAHRWGHVTLV
jgi:hypothetical protein